MTAHCILISIFKTSLLNLIPRFYNIKSGDIKIDNQSIYQTKIKSLRNQISLVSQDTTLFDDTIRNNIAYAKFDATDDEISKACKFAAAEEFINKMPEKYNTIVGENGIKLSGGQKQRICIARALAAEPDLIICDEVTSALDQIVQEGILKLLLRLQKELSITYIFITHDIATVKAISDEVVVMHNGLVVEQGMKSEIFSPPHPDYTKLLLSSVPEMDPNWLTKILSSKK